jgi:hypothetical protein
MASVLKDPAVVEHVTKQVAKATAAAHKAAIAGLKNYTASHVATLGDDKAAVKAVKTFSTAATSVLKAAAMPPAA